MQIDAYLDTKFLQIDAKQYVFLDLTEFLILVILLF